jgi:hypothetical protein
MNRFIDTLFVQTLLIAINQKNSQSTFCRGLAPLSFSFSFYDWLSSLLYSVVRPCIPIILQLLDSQFQFSDPLAESESYGQSASLSWNKAPIWGLRSDFYYCQTVAGLLMWGTLSVASYDSQGYGGDIRTHLHTGNNIP